MSDTSKLQELCNKTYRDQAVWFLNCFWLDFAEKEAERLWQYVLKNEELDLEHHKDGTGLDEMKAHVFLEKFDETLTVRDMRDKLRATGAIGQTERPKTVPLTHYLLYKYSADWRKLVDETRQGGNQEELQEAERLVREVAAAFQESEAKASEARKALLEAQSTENAAVSRENEAKSRESAAKSAEAEAVARENEAKTAEAPFKAAQEEVSSALAEVHAQEAEYNGKIADCERRSSEGGVVQQNKAKAELAQLRAEDPLPLRKAKITLEAAEKRAAKARAPFEAATKIASEARAAASAAASAASNARAEASKAREAASRAAQASAQAKEAAEAALDAASQRLSEAEAYLAEVKSKPGVSFGSIWWIDRELFEQRKYLPTSRGGIAK